MEVIIYSDEEGTERACQMFSPKCFYPECKSDRRPLYFTCKLHRRLEDEIRLAIKTTLWDLQADELARERVKRAFNGIENWCEKPRKTFNKTSYLYKLAVEISNQETDYYQCKFIAHHLANALIKLKQMKPRQKEYFIWVCCLDHNDETT